MFYAVQICGRAIKILFIARLLNADINNGYGLLSGNITNCHFRMMKPLLTGSVATETYRPALRRKTSRGGNRVQLPGTARSDLTFP